MIESALTAIFVNQWAVFGIVSLLLIGMAEVGFRFGKQVHQNRDKARKEQIGNTQGAVLGMLALLIGFTFAMAVGRYDNRRSLVLDEANSIGTTFLRTDFLPPAYQNEAKDLLRDYVDARLDFYAAGTDKEAVEESESTTQALQKQLWALAVRAGGEAPTPLVATFVTSLNETIDLDATRLQAYRTHVPGAVWILVLVVATCGCTMTGYSAGASGSRNAFNNLIVPLLVTVVITLIADLDRARGGLIAISQQPMLDLKSTLEK